MEYIVVENVKDVDGAVIVPVGELVKLVDTDENGNTYETIDGRVSFTEMEYEHLVEQRG